MNQIIYIIALGLLATAFMDIWAFVQKHLFGIMPLDYRLLGRWLLSIRQGRFYHHTIMQTQPLAGERIVGWVMHYLIGVIFAAILLHFSHPPALLPSLLMGWITVFIPFFLMQPAFGFGIAGAKTPKPNIVRRNSLLAHTSFGIGLYLGGWLLSNYFGI